MKSQTPIERSLRQAGKSILSWQSLLGIIAAAVSILNFIHELLQFPLTIVVGHLLAAYEKVIHGAIDWLTLPLHLDIPGPIKDGLFLYCVIGGAFMRARIAEGIYLDQGRIKPLCTILRIVVWPKRSLGCIVVPGERGLSTGGRIKVAYQVSPLWLRRVFDFALWPRVAIQYWMGPMVYFHEYGGTFQSFAPGYTPGPHKEFLYDRRLIFALQIGAVAAAVFCFFVLNGF